MQKIIANNYKIINNYKLLVNLFGFILFFNVSKINKLIYTLMFSFSLFIMFYYIFIWFILFLIYFDIYLFLEHLVLIGTPEENGDDSFSPSKPDNNNKPNNNSNDIWINKSKDENDIHELFTLSYEDRLKLEAFDKLPLSIEQAFTRADIELALENNPNFTHLAPFINDPVFGNCIIINRDQGIESISCVGCCEVINAYDKAIINNRASILTQHECGHVSIGKNNCHNCALISNNLPVLPVYHPSITIPTKYVV